MNTTIVIQLITGALGSVGFGILFHMKKKYLPLAAAESVQMSEDDTADATGASDQLYPADHQ